MAVLEPLAANLKSKRGLRIRASSIQQQVVSKSSSTPESSQGDTVAFSKATVTHVNFFTADGVDRTHQREYHARTS
ncbi:hypothetical protein RRG08_063735 [Elysia crispata]|uniref:Uncharacterized protein n=1 Tax=Elysia crispata TaxID=231223 RepID=A0AAE0YAS1_9GAST|nr:hypothetical protein RRG08_063735 [Elysia crispata]